MSILSESEFNAKVEELVTEYHKLAGDSTASGYVVCGFKVNNDFDIELEWKECTQASGLLYCEVDFSSIAQEAREALADEQGVDIEADGFDVEDWIDENSDALEALEHEYTGNEVAVWLSEQAYKDYMDACEKELGR